MKTKLRKLWEFGPRLGSKVPGTVTDRSLGRCSGPRELNRTNFAVSCRTHQASGRATWNQLKSVRRLALGIYICTHLGPTPSSCTWILSKIPQITHRKRIKPLRILDYSESLIVKPYILLRVWLYSWSSRWWMYGSGWAVRRRVNDIR